MNSKPMYAKLTALALGVLVFGTLHWATAPHSVNRADTIDRINLLPANIGSAAIVEKWNNRQSAQVVEQGARYASNDSADTPVQLDFFKGRPNTHNGIICYLWQGEALLWQRLESVATAGRPAIFDVGLTRAGQQLRLVAATECSAESCTEQPLPVSGYLWTQWRWKNLIQTGNPVVPVSIVLSRPIGAEGLEATQSQLLAAFYHAAALIDLSPAQQLAAAQW
jgi:hypothetical protein